MPSQITTTAQIDPAVAVFYDRALLERAIPEFLYNMFGQSRGIPKKSGNTIKFRRYNSLTIANVPLSEGVPPALQSLSRTDLLATVQQYGAAIGITDWVEYTVQDNVLNEANDLNGEQMGLTHDTLLRDILCASASYYACTAGNNTKTPTQLTTADIDGGVMVLMGGNAKFITEIKKAGTGVGTTPVRKCFAAIGHTEEFTALNDCVDSLSVEKYPQADPMHDSETHSVHNTRWFLTTNCKTIAGNPKVYHNVVLARNAYGVTDIDGTTIQHIFKDFGSGGTTDPLNQQASMGWKSTFTARILNDLWILVLGASNKAGTT
jgi:N4-gp56 family major capsid protein